MAVTVLVGLLGLTQPQVTQAQTEVSGVLLVGNSFIRGARKPLRRAFRDTGTKVLVKGAHSNGWALYHHARSKRTTKRLERFPWDWVVLQEQSDGIDADRFEDARALNSRIVAHGSRTMFFMTWRDRGEPVEEYDELRGVIGGVIGYVPIAYELGAPIAPVGWGIREAVVNGLPFDLWHDGHHLSRLMRYYSGWVLYSSITMESPIGLPAPRRFDPGAVAWAQQLAHTTVFDDPAQWFLPAP